MKKITSSDFSCKDALTGNVTMCARKCDRINDGCQRNEDEMGCSPNDYMWTGIGAALGMIFVIILLIESILYK